jgi:hypothetical protein
LVAQLMVSVLALPTMNTRPSLVVFMLMWLSASSVVVPGLLGSASSDQFPATVGSEPAAIVAK